MNFLVRPKNDKPFLEGEPFTRLMQTPENVVDIINACFGNGVRALLLYPGNLTPGFSDLSTGEAGSILQYLRKYQVKLALVLPKGRPYGTTMFREMTAEENKGDYFRTFEDRAEAEAWLRQE